MAEIITFTGNHAERRDYRYISRPIPIRPDGIEIHFPCIVMEDMTTGLIVNTPGYERWLFDLSMDEQKATQTMKKRAVHLTAFLNYLLWETGCPSLHEVDLNTLRHFMMDYRTKETDELRDPVEWMRGIDDVLRFLVRFEECNREKFRFAYDPSLLMKTETVRDYRTGRTRTIARFSRLSVKPPEKTGIKNRLLPYEYLPLLLYECRAHDPMIAMPAALGAYGGIREGEAVNLSIGSIRIKAGSFGVVGKIIADLTRDADFALKWNGKTEFGFIKVHRAQEIYTDFLPEVSKLYYDHLALLRSRGYSTDSVAPLLVNDQGKPMTADVYTRRLKRIFYEFFLPDLERTSNSPTNAAFIEAYETEYPGAHMLRHWFTMYLLQKAHLKPEEVSKWRGDRSPTSLLTYLHVNAEMLRLYQNTLYVFQKSLFEEIR